MLFDMFKIFINMYLFMEHEVICRLHGDALRVVLVFHR